MQRRRHFTEFARRLKLCVDMVPAQRPTSPTAIDLHHARDAALPKRRVRKDAPEAAEAPAPEPATEVVARDVLRVYDPAAASGKLCLLNPGCAGAVPFAVTTGSHQLCLKVRRAAPDIVPGVPTRKQSIEVQALMDEAQRARWAGDHGVGPVVRLLDDQQGAYACDFVTGRTVEPHEARGTYLPAFMAAMGRLHAAPTDAMPSAGPRNWLYDQDLTNCLANADAQQPRAYQSSVLQLERGIETWLDRASFPLTPIHDDLHAGNALVGRAGVTLVDWAGLKLGDAMVDPAHFACWTDLSVRHAPTMLRLYGNNHADLQRLQLRLTWFRLKTATFFDQWSGTRDRAREYRYLLLEDVDAIRICLAEDLGLRFARPVA